MRPAIRFLGLGIGTALSATALVAVLGGCGLGDGGITIVGANPHTAGVSVPVAARGTAAAQPLQPQPSQLQSQPTNSATGAVATDAEAAAACSASDLRLSATWSATESGTAEADDVSGSDAGVTSRQSLALVYVNVSAAVCVLSGYPSVDFVRAGTGGPLSELDTSATKPRTVSRVELAPGGGATATASFTTNGPLNAGGSRCDGAVAVRTSVPGSSTAMTSSVDDAHGNPLQQFFVCGHGVVVSSFVP